MGLDFIRKTAKSYYKALDQSRIELATPDLFGQISEANPRCYAAVITGRNPLKEGDVLCIRSDGGQIYAMRGLSKVAEFLSPPDGLLEAMAAAYGEAWGTVEKVHKDAGVAEISVC